MTVSLIDGLQALIDWFPDKKGLASGLVIAGFGSGALFFTPMMNMLTNKFSVLPTYLGSRFDSLIVALKVPYWIRYPIPVKCVAVYK